MKRRMPKPSAVSKVSDKSQTDGAMPLDKAPAHEADNPFAIFSEWSSETDEKAYADL
jgi:hypothetical protein